MRNLHLHCSSCLGDGSSIILMASTLMLSGGGVNVTKEATRFGLNNTFVINILPFIIFSWLHVDEGHVFCRFQTTEYHVLYQQVLCTFHTSGLFCSKRFILTQKAF